MGPPALRVVESATGGQGGHSRETPPSIPYPVQSMALGDPLQPGSLSPGLPWSAGILPIKAPTLWSACGDGPKFAAYCVRVSTRALLSIGCD